jgi:ganglioside GM2 activator
LELLSAIKVTKKNQKFQALEVEIRSFQKLPETDPSVVNFGTLRLKKKSRNRFVIDGHFELFINIGNDIKAHFEVTNSKGSTIMKSTQNMCDFLKYDQLIWPDLQKHSNMPNRCPFPKGKYHIRDFDYDASHIPKATPPGVYTVKAYASENNVINNGWIAVAELMR